MECFNDLIGVRDMCALPNPKTAIYLDDVGLTLLDIEAFAGGNYATPLDYFNSRQAQAIREVEQMIYTHFQDRYSGTSLIDSHRLGIYSGTQVLAAGIGYQGIRQEFTQSDSFFKTGIAEISLLVNVTQTVPVVVYDMLQNKLLHTLNIDCVAGEISTGYLQKDFKSDKRPLNLFIGYDTTGISSYRTPIKENLCCGKNYCSNSYMVSQGVRITGTFYDANATVIDHTSGLSIVYDIKCDHLSWLCSHASSLSLAIAFKTAEVMVSDALFNSGGERATNSHTINMETLQKRYDFYAFKFGQVMTGWLSNMQLPRNRCFSCDTPIRHKISLP